MNAYTKVISLKADVTFELDGFKGKYWAASRYVTFGCATFRVSAASDELLKAILANA